MSPEIIWEFREEWEFLSNFFPATISWEGMTFPTSEHAYQASKTTDELQRELISQLPTPGQAKRMGQKLDLRPDWGEIKEEVMFEVLWRKFSDPVLRRKLLDTGSAKLVEGNIWGDEFWGVDLRTGVGENKLGKALMEVRDEIRRRAGEGSQPTQRSS